MEAKDIVDLKTVKTGMNAESKEEALRELIELLVINGYVTNADGFMKDVYAREKIGQTGIGNYIAIPHGKSKHVKKTGVAIGINKNEIPWETLDDNGVKVIILFCVGNDNEAAQNHLKLLSLFAKKLGNDEVVENLLKSKNAEDVKKSFNN